MELNKVYQDDCLHFMRQLSAASLPLVIADPPYYRVKGAFDFLWPSYAAYLTWCLQAEWYRPCQRQQGYAGAHARGQRQGEGAGKVSQPFYGGINHD